MIVTIIISVIISVLVSLFIIAWANNEVSLSSFKIESFNMDTDKTSYTYSENSYSYKGKGIVSCTNKELDYLVLIEQNDKKNNKKEYNYLIVHNGEGEFSTYDSSYSGTTEKPEYEFKILGYRSFRK